MSGKSVYACSSLTKIGRIIRNDIGYQKAKAEALHSAFTVRAFFVLFFGMVTMSLVFRYDECILYYLFK